jgi:hypothetical protein
MLKKQMQAVQIKLKQMTVHVLSSLPPHHKHLFLHTESNETDRHNRLNNQIFVVYPEMKSHTVFGSPIKQRK